MSDLWIQKFVLLYAFVYLLKFYEENNGPLMQHFHKSLIKATMKTVINIMKYEIINIMKSRNLLKQLGNLKKDIFLCESLQNFQKNIKILNSSKLRTPS